MSRGKLLCDLANAAVEIQSEGLERNEENNTPSKLILIYQTCFQQAELIWAVQLLFLFCHSYTST